MLDLRDCVNLIVNFMIIDIFVDCFHFLPPVFISCAHEFSQQTAIALKKGFRGLFGAEQPPRQIRTRPAEFCRVLERGWSRDQAHIREIFAWAAALGYTRFACDQAQKWPSMFPDHSLSDLLNCRTFTTASPMFLACKNGQIDMVRQLLYLGASGSQTNFIIFD
jgi:hypothetical protein